MLYIDENKICREYIGATVRLVCLSACRSVALEQWINYGSKFRCSFQGNAVELYTCNHHGLKIRKIFCFKKCQIRLTGS